MIERDELISFLDRTLNPQQLAMDSLPDIMANGAQVLGNREIHAVGFGVTLSHYSLEQALAKGCQCCVFHHGLDLRIKRATVSSILQQRLLLILKSNLTILGYHYLLDSHPQLGNSAQLAGSLSLVQIKPCYGGWGVVGNLKTSQSTMEFIKAVEAVLGRETRSVQVSSSVSRVAVITGAGKPDAYELSELAALGVDTLVTGEASEAMPHLCQEQGLNYIVGGHYQTEVFGPRSLMQLVQDTYPQISTVWLDAEHQW